MAGVEDCSIDCADEPNPEGVRTLTDFIRLEPRPETLPAAAEEEEEALLRLLPIPPAVLLAGEAEVAVRSPLPVLSCCSTNREVGEIGSFASVGCGAAKSDDRISRMS